jgi:hypothetical protein
MSLRAETLCSCVFSFLSVIYLLLNIFEWRNLRGSPGLLGITLAGISPSQKIQSQREWLLTAKLLLGLASTVILDSESHGTHGHILLSEGSGSLQPLTWNRNGYLMFLASSKYLVRTSQKTPVCVAVTFITITV